RGGAGKTGGPENAQPPPGPPPGPPTLPPRHREFLAGLPWCVEHPHSPVVHAGLTAEPFAGRLEVLRRRDFTLTRPPWLHERRLAWADLPADCPLAVVSGFPRCSCRR